ncbi:hypothetical protein [Ferruginibacter sp.]|nr:hypothetical protein [Ferruginibacter sp.]
MLNKKSKLFLALLIGASVSITACNNEGESKPASTEADKKTEAPADTTMKKSDTTQRPIIPGN